MRKERETMRNFDYSTLASMSWDSEIIGLVAQIHEYKGRQELYLKQKPAELDRLIEVAKVKNIASSRADSPFERLSSTTSFANHVLAD